MTENRGDPKETILETTQTITGVRSVDGAVAFSIGVGGVTKIEAYGEPGQRVLVPYIAIYHNGEVLARMPAHALVIYYRNQHDGAPYFCGTHRDHRFGDAHTAEGCALEGQEWGDVRHIDMDFVQLIDRAFNDAHARRPYPTDYRDGLTTDKLIPDGGLWHCDVNEGAITRTVTWRGREVANVNPRGDMDDILEGQIAMAIVALPLLDKALRAIIVLSEDPAHLDAIRKLALLAVAKIEHHAPGIPEPEEEAEVERPPLVTPTIGDTTDEDEEIQF